MINYKLIDFKGFVCNYDDKIYDVMLEIESNSQGIVFLKNDHNQLIASLSDGDIRRWIIKGGELGINSIEIANKSVQYVFHESKDILVKKLEEIYLKYELQLIPILDNDRRILNIAIIGNAI